VDSGTPEQIHGGLGVEANAQFLAQAFSLFDAPVISNMKSLSAVLRAKSRCSIPRLLALQQLLLT
jgi:hypothetical protein